MAFGKKKLSSKPVAAKKKSGLDHEKIKKSRQGNGRIGFKCKEGDNILRILPPYSKYLNNWGEMDHFAVKYEVHFFEVPGSDQKVVSRCLTDLKKPCPACAVSKAHKDDEDPVIKEMSDSVRRKSQYLFNVIDMNDRKAGIQPWLANYTCWDGIVDIGEKEQWGNIVDPEEGTNFTVTLTPGTRTKTRRNEYTVTPDREQTDITRILSKIPNWESELDKLDAMIPAAKTEAEMYDLLEEMGFTVKRPKKNKTRPVDDEDDDDIRSLKKSNKRRPVDDDEDEEEDDDDVRPIRRKSRNEDDDEDSDDDIDDADDDEDDDSDDDVDDAEDEDEDSEDSDDEEEEEEDSEDSDDDEEDDEDDEEDDEDEDEDEEDEDDEPASRRRAPLKKSAPSRKKK